MIMNATRSTYEIQQHAISLLPSKFLFSNLDVLLGKSFNPIRGFINSIIISTGATACAVYFSSLTAYALVAYNWRLRQPFFTFIMVVMMIPGQVTSIGFYQFMYKIGMTNNYLPLILPAIAAPAMVFFMRQYLLASLSIDIVNSGRIDGAGEFGIFNRIIIPIMKPAIATQAIFSFVTSWNSLFMPMILLTDTDKYTMPIMVSLLRGDIYKTEFGSVYLGLTLTVLPLFIVYFMLSKYIIAGVALGGVKE
jgi:multiple sugar transport system permease protein